MKSFRVRVRLLDLIPRAKVDMAEQKSQNCSFLRCAGSQYVDLLKSARGTWNTLAILYTSTYFTKNLKLFLKSSEIFSYVAPSFPRKKHVFGVFERIKRVHPWVCFIFFNLVTIIACTQVIPRYIAYTTAPPQLGGGFAWGLTKKLFLSQKYTNWIDIISPDVSHL